MSSKNEVPPKSDDTIKKEAEVAQEAEIKQSEKEKLIALAKANKISKEGLEKMGLSPDEVTEVLAAIQEKVEPAATSTDKTTGGNPLKEKEAEIIEKTKADLEATFNKEDARAEEERLNKRMKEIGLSNYDFSTIPQWATLSHGQKMLVLEQAAQDIHKDVKDTAKERFQKKNKINTTLNFTKWNPFSLGKKVWRNMAKAYYVSEEEKKAVLEAAQGDMMPEEVKLNALVERMADMDLPVVEKGGKSTIEFEALDTNMSPEQQAIIKNYNEVANEFARMPDSWKNKNAAKNSDSFSKKNYEKYQEAKARYEHARSIFIEARVKEQQEKGIEEKDAHEQTMLAVKDSDFKIAMLQFTNMHPDAIGELKRIHETSSFKKVFSDNETVWRGLYMGTGWAARSVAATTLGAMTGPLVASIIGGIRARRKAQEKINEAFDSGRKEKTFREMTPEERLALRGNFIKDANGENIETDQFVVDIKTGKLIRTSVGIRDGAGIFEDKNANKKGLLANIMPGVTAVNAREVAGFIDADSQIQRITNLMGKIDAAQTPMEKAELMLQLTARIDYIDQKKKEGLINFGTTNPVGLNYSFLKILSEAEMKSQILNEETPLDLTPAQIQALYEQTDRRTSLTQYVTNLGEAKREYEQRYFKNTETARGAVVGAGFSFLGWKIRDWFHGGHPDVSGVKEAVVPASTTTTIIDTHPGTPPTPTVHETIPHHVTHTPTPVKHEPMELPKPEKVEDLKPLEGDWGNNGQPIAPKEGVFNTDTDGAISPKTGDFGQGDGVKSEFELNNPQKPLDEVDFKTTPEVKSQFLNENPQTELPKVTGTDVDHPVKTGLSEFEKANPQTKLDDITPATKPGIPTDQSGVKSEFLNQNPQTELPKVTGTEIPTGANNLDNIPKVSGTVPAANINSAPTGDMSPLEGKFNVTADKIENFGDRGVVNTTVPGDNGFTREVPLTQQVPLTKTEEYEYLTRTGSTPRVMEIKGSTVNIEQDPRHVESMAELKREIGRYDYKHNTIIEKPEQETINDVDYKDWNKGVDHMLQEKKVKFDSYESYEKERELQTLFGNGKKVVEYVPSLDKNAEVLKINYFRELPEWKIASRVPANYFTTDFDHAQEMINGKLVDMPKEDFDQLIKAGILKPKLNIDGTQAGGYEFAHKSELLRISKTYSKLLTDKDIELGNDKPLITLKDPETIEDYVGRMMRPVHQADDGTFFVFKKNVTLENNTTDGMVVATERIPSRVVQNGAISPTNGYWGSNTYYNPNYGLASRVVDLLLGNSSYGSSSPVRMWR